MTNKVITCFFCFEQFEVSLEVDKSFTGNDIDIYDCEVCCNPNKLEFIWIALHIVTCVLIIAGNGRTLEWW